MKPYLKIEDEVTVSKKKQRRTRGKVIGQKGKGSHMTCKKEGQGKMREEDLHSIHDDPGSIASRN